MSMLPFLFSIFDLKHKKAQSVMEKMKEWVNQCCFLIYSRSPTSVYTTY